jgi:2-polyprenyl-6-methoxyphenol hydroxylase-like FAD-dependent oxidoreductase
MAKERSFKIVIVGGGISGLVLAKMLEKFDIDYVLLESRNEVAPPVGASIGLMPNGLLILDQLGCYEAIAKAAQGTRIDEAHTRSSAGKSLGSTKDFLGHVEQRYSSRRQKLQTFC